MKAVNFSDPITFKKNQTLVDLLGQDGFYFVIDNPDVLAFGGFGSAPLPDAGTIVSQAPAENTFALKGTILHVTVSPLQENRGPTS